MKRILTIAMTALLCMSAAAKNLPEVTIPASDSRLTWIGRTVKAGDVRFNWSGTSVCVRFSGRNLSLRASDTESNWFNVWVDKVPCSDPDAIFITSRADSTFVLASGLAKGEHEVYIQRRTEGRRGVTTFTSFTADGEFLQARPVKPRIIEFIGDSLTAGYGNESEDINEGYRIETQNAAKTYAALLGRYFDADVLTIAHSGMGVARNTGDKMPGVYMDTLYGLAIDCMERATPEEAAALPAWDAASGGYKPAITVIFLGANDFSKETQPSVERFSRHYRKLIGEVKANYGEDHPVLCVAYERRSLIDSYVREATRGMKEVSFVALGTSVMHYDARDLAAAHHPKLIGQIKYAYALLPYIATMTGWELSEPAF